HRGKDRRAAGGSSGVDINGREVGGVFGEFHGRALLGQRGRGGKGDERNERGEQGQRPKRSGQAGRRLGGDRRYGFFFHDVSFFLGLGSGRILGSVKRAVASEQMRFGDARTASRMWRGREGDHLRLEQPCGPQTDQSSKSM